jgi:hypothetical protein
MRFFNLNNKKKKGRQGRSMEVRRKKELERQGWYQGQRYFFQSDQIPKCRECGSQNCFVEDHSSGDLICTSCGVVSEELGGLGFVSNCFTHNPLVSKPYQKVVHFRQRISQLLCRDPEQEFDHLRMIRDYVIRENYRLGNPSFYGIKTFSYICRALGLNPKIASHWMQIRKRLGIEPSCYPNPSPELLHRITMRYICVAHCFDSTLRRKRGEASPNPLKRNNVINLNYSIIQLIRMESESEFFRLAKFFPQLISHNQPALNNKRWEIILEECRTKYSKFSDPLRGEPFSFDWPYKPILVEDLVKYFYFFY